MGHPLALFKYCPKCGSSSFKENNSKSKKCHTCGFLYYFNSSSAVVAVILNDDNELLVATRAFDPAKGTFDLPGGFVDSGESLEKALLREVKEETNLDLVEYKYLFSIPNLYQYSGFQVETTDVFFLCKVEKTSALHAQDDVSQLNFMKIGDLLPEKFGLVSVREGVKKIINENLLKHE